MDMSTVTVIFRLLAVLGGVFLGIFAYKIYRYSKGGLTGWKYLSLFGGGLCFWAVTALITKFIGIGMLESLTGIIGFLVMAFSIPFAYTLLGKELKLPIPGWLTGKTSLLFVGIVFVALLGLNMLMPGFMNHPLDKILSISYVTLSIATVFGLIPLSILTFKIKKAPWILVWASTVLLALSLILGQQYNGCCGTGGEMTDSSVCSGYELPYVPVTNLPCTGFLIPIGSLYQIFLATGVLILTGGYFQMARLFARMAA
ncbi:MAG: hypothetical protein R6V53_05620 [Candidatus Woesearchaeota archaeon]